MIQSSAIEPTPAELDANRAGRLADPQRALLEQRITTLRWILIAVLGGMFGMWAFITLVVASRFSPDPVTAVTMLILFIALSPIFVWMWWRWTRQVRGDLDEGMVQAHTGVLQFSGNTMYIGSEWFPRPNSTLGLEPHTLYRVYYAPRSRVVVAIEKSGK